MRSSISSSDAAADRVERLPWLLLLGLALILAAVFACALELSLRMRGFRPVIEDSQAAWEKQRERAASLGRRAMILVGDSRMQTDLNLDLLRERTRMEPVELAVEGNSGVPVLTGLARDPRVTGTVLVGYAETGIVRWNYMTMTAIYEKDYESRPHASGLPDFHASEDALQDSLHARMASYADGSTPLTALLVRAMGSAPAQQYILTLPDRSRLVDYSHADLRRLNYRHGIFEIDNEVPPTQPDMDRSERVLRARIEALQPADRSEFAVRSAEIEASVKAIQGRGGRVVFVAMPTGGYVSDIDARMFPRALYWDWFCGRSSARCLHSDDHPRMKKFSPADGLHLDQFQRTPFTAALIEALGLDDQARK